MIFVLLGAVRQLYTGINTHSFCTRGGGVQLLSLSICVSYSTVFGETGPPIQTAYAPPGSGDTDAYIPSL